MHGSNQMPYIKLITPSGDLFTVPFISNFPFPQRMKAPNLTRGQLERTLSQQLEALYYDKLGHRPSKVICHINGEQITLLLEESITPPEQLLTDSGQDELAERVRLDLEKALRPQISELIENMLGIPVVDMLSDATFDTGRTGTIVILASAPQLRDNVASNNKSKKQA